VSAFGWNSLASRCTDEPLRAARCLTTDRATEKKAFEEALQLFGRGNWKRIANHMKTRNPLQVKNHARAYFKRIEKEGKPLPPLAKRKNSKRVQRQDDYHEFDTDEEIEITDDLPPPPVDAAPIVPDRAVFPLQGQHKDESSSHDFSAQEPRVRFGKTVEVSVRFACTAERLNQVQYLPSVADDRSHDDADSVASVSSSRGDSSRGSISQVSACLLASSLIRV
jgi:hypothetical protein